MKIKGPTPPDKLEQIRELHGKMRRDDIAKLIGISAKRVQEAFRDLDLPVLPRGRRKEGPRPTVMEITTPEAKRIVREMHSNHIRTWEVAKAAGLTERQVHDLRREMGLPPLRRARKPLTVGQVWRNADDTLACRVVRVDRVNGTVTIAKTRIKTATTLINTFNEWARHQGLKLRATHYET
jgi:hypothetical protein